MNSVEKKKKLELLGDCRAQRFSFMWMPDADRCVTTVTAGQAEITAFAAAFCRDTEYLLNTSRDFFFFLLLKGSTVSSQRSHHKAGNFLSAHCNTKRPFTKRWGEGGGGGGRRG